MLIKKSDTKEIKNANTCTVWEYACPSELFSFAKVMIDGRYPEEKRVTNLECAEIYYVTAGTGTIHSSKGNFKINKGDLYFFEKGEIYWVEGQKLSLVIVNSPKWKPTQYKIVE